MVVVLLATIGARVFLAVRALSVSAVISRLHSPVRRRASITFDPWRTVTLLAVIRTCFRRSLSLAFISGGAITVEPGLRF